MKSEEIELCKAFKLMLESNMELGVPTNDQDDHISQYLHEEINDAFRVDVAGLVHYDSVCSAFAKVHLSQHLNSPKFVETIQNEMKSRAVPLEEQTTVVKTVEKLAKKYLDETDGYSKELPEILKQTRGE